MKSKSRQIPDALAQNKVNKTQLPLAYIIVKTPKNIA